MNLTLSQIITLIVVVWTIIISIKNIMINKDLEDVIVAIIGSISSVISFFIIFLFYNFFNIKIEKFLLRISPDKTLNIVIKLLILLIIFFVIKWIIYTVFRLINSIFSFNFNRLLSNNKSLLFIFSILLGFIRGMLIVLCILIAVVTYNGFTSPKYKINMFSNLKAYHKISNLIDEKRISKIKSGLVEDISNSTVVYYNGITLKEGIKSNSEINNKAIEITAPYKTDREKAKAIYTWIGTHIRYDDDKADKIMNKNNVTNSGAIETFKSRKGICFDYACLYVAMCRAVNIKVRMIIGEAYNGEEYISHAWNQVYLKNQRKWINVDPTFYMAGNYFNNPNFNSDHKEKSIAGEW